MSDRKKDIEAMNRIMALAEMRVVGFEELEEKYINAIPRIKEALNDPSLDDKRKVLKIKTILDVAEGRIKIWGNFAS